MFQITELARNSVNWLYRIRRKRPSLRIIISSATLDVARFSDYFNASEHEATSISLEGRMYPVEVAYAVDPTPDYVQMAAELAFKINRQVCLCVLYRNHSTNCC